MKLKYYTIKLPHNSLISHASKVMLKILQVRLKQCMNCELPDVQLDLEKAEELEQIANIFWIIKRAREFQKTSTSALLTTSKPFTVWITTNCGKFLMGMPDNLICLLRCFYAGQEATVRTRHGTMDWFQIGKGVRPSWILSPCLFNFYADCIMRNAGLDEAQAGIKIAGRNINNLRYADDTTLLAENELLKSFLMKVKVQKLFVSPGRSLNSLYLSFFMQRWVQ